LTPPGATSTEAFGINARGQIVGRYTDGSGTQHGFLLDNGSFATIDIPGATRTDAIGINNRGQFVGLSIDVRGTFHGFVATP
jgi:probable HAF family extracellular repeat protein